MIIAIDFDNTLCYSNYPDCGEPNLPLIHKLIELRNQGHELILWTCRIGEPLEKAVAWCKSYGLEFDKVNEHLDRLIETFHNDTRKIYADVYIDDKNVTIEEFLKG